MVVWILSTFLSLVLVTGLFSQTSEHRNIAILSFEARGVSPIESEAVADRIRSEITRADVYQVVERGLMEEIMEEQAFQLTGAAGVLEPALVHLHGGGENSARGLENFSTTWNVPTAPWATLRPGNMPGPIARKESQLRP